MNTWQRRVLPVQAAGYELTSGVEGAVLAQ